MIDYVVEPTNVLIDSGASKSIFSSKHYFPDSLCCTTQNIRFGNGPAIPVRAMGTVKLPCPCSSGMCFMHISNCLFVPQQQFKILSVHHLKSLGHTVDLHCDAVTWNSCPPFSQPIHWIHNLPYLLSTKEVHSVMHLQESVALKQVSRSAGSRHEIPSSALQLLAITI